MTSVRVGLAIGCALGLAVFGAAQEPASVVAPLLRLLESGRLPAERQPAVVEMVAKRGAAADLAVLLERVVKADGFPPALRRQTCGWLLEAAQTRKVQPAGDLAPLAQVLDDAEQTRDAALLRVAVQLAAAWRVTSLAPRLQALATGEATPADARRAAIAGLGQLEDAASQAALVKLAAAGPVGTRFLAIAALAPRDEDAAARLTAAALAAATPRDDPAPALDALLARKTGADKLAAALRAAPPTADVAKVALRHMYGAGRNDPALSDALSAAAGIAADPPPPTPDELKRLVAEVEARGNAPRGELVFRRKDLGCFNCHALARAGGQVGPDLSSVGATSPLDYVVSSILDPSAQIKEAYLTKVFDVADGRRLTGIVVDRDDNRVQLREATGKLVTIAVDDIDDEREGKSLMPQGVTKFLTHDELLDLAKFVGELGKPGPYALRATPTLQRWRVLREPAAELLDESPNVEQVRVHLLDSPAEAWGAAYGMVSGELPLADVAPADARVVYLYGELDVVTEGPAELRASVPAGTQLWLDAEPFDPAAPIVAELSAGRRRVTLRVPLPTEGPPGHIKVELHKPTGSPAQFDAVAGE